MVRLWGKEKDTGVSSAVEHDTGSPGAEGYDNLPAMICARVNNAL